MTSVEKFIKPLTGEPAMTNLEIVAAARDEAIMKLRKAIQERDAALAEVARLKGGAHIHPAREAQADAAAKQSGLVPEVPAGRPPKGKTPRIPG
jgi:hypothetical protein